MESKIKMKNMNKKALVWLIVYKELAIILILGYAGLKISQWIGKSYIGVLFFIVAFLLIHRWRIV